MQAECLIIPGKIWLICHVIAVGITHEDMEITERQKRRKTDVGQQKSLEETSAGADFTYDTVGCVCLDSSGK